MSRLPKTPTKIHERIKRYERELRQELKNFGAIHDGSGKRYLLGPLYLLLGDTKGAVRSFNWFEKSFPDDMGEREILFLLPRLQLHYKRGMLRRSYPFLQHSQEGGQVA